MYCIKSLLDPETSYQKIEKMVLALFVVSRKLKHYFQSFQIIMLTEHPLKNIVENPHAPGRIAKWAMELKSYSIRYELRTVIKWQVLADFIVKFTPGAPAQSDLREGWVVNVDGASNNKGYGIEIVLTTPEGSIIEQVLHLGLPCYQR